MTAIVPLATVSIGVVVERNKGAGPWTDFLWKSVNVLDGVPNTPVWTKLSDDGERALFYAGAAEIELYRSEAPNYRENLITEMPLLWVALRPTEADPPYVLAGVTADPGEGEAWAGIGNDIVDTVPMPAVVEDVVAAFVSEHYVEQAFHKRKRNRADLEAFGRRVPKTNDDKS